MINRTHNQTFSGTSPVTVNYPTTGISANAAAFIIASVKYAPLVPETPEGWNPKATISGGSGAPGVASGFISGTQYERILDGSESGDSFQITVSGANCVSASLDIYQSDIPGALIEAVNTSGIDNTPGSTWNSNLLDNLELLPGDLVVVWSTDNRNSGPSRSNHKLVPASTLVGTAVEFRDGGWNVGDGLGGCAVEFRIEELETTTYSHTSSFSGANSRCGITFLTRLREVLPGE